MVLDKVTLHTTMLFARDLSLGFPLVLACKFREPAARMLLLVGNTLLAITFLPTDMLREAWVIPVNGTRTSSPVPENREFIVPLLGIAASSVMGVYLIELIHLAAELEPDPAEEHQPEPEFLSYHTSPRENQSKNSA